MTPSLRAVPPEHSERCAHGLGAGRSAGNRRTAQPPEGVGRPSYCPRAGNMNVSATVCVCVTECLSHLESQAWKYCPGLESLQGAGDLRLEAPAVWIAADDRCSLQERTQRASAVTQRTATSFHSGSVCPSVQVSTSVGESEFDSDNCCP